MHHSSHRPETDSNYSAGFPIWDLLLGTFRSGEHPPTELGLTEYRGSEVDHSAVMLEQCRKRHRRAIAAGRLTLHQASFTALPDIGLVDRMLDINSLRFDALNDAALPRILARRPG